MTFARWVADPRGVVVAAPRDVYRAYRPPPLLERLVRARDDTCRFPGCVRAAERCDLDHTVPHPAGATRESNLAALCRRHHRLKTHTRWRVRHLPGAVLEWRSPAGRIHVTRPPDQLRLPTLGAPAADDDVPAPF